MSPDEKDSKGRPKIDFGRGFIDGTSGQSRGGRDERGPEVHLESKQKKTKDMVDRYDRATTKLNENKKALSQLKGDLKKYKAGDRRAAKNFENFQNRLDIISRSITVQADALKQVEDFLDSYQESEIPSPGSGQLRPVEVMKEKLAVFIGSIAVFELAITQIETILSRFNSLSDEELQRELDKI